MAKRSKPHRSRKSSKSRKSPTRRVRGRASRSRGSARPKRRKFTLPNNGRTLYVSEDRYPRLYEWIQRAEEDE